MKTLVDQIRSGDRALYITGFVHLALAVLFLLATQADPRTVNGEPVWMKPFRFAIAIFFFTWTYAWFSGFYQNKKTVKVLNLLISLCMFVEIALIGMQAFRGVPSHFNTATAFDATVFSVMGGAIGFNAAVLGIHFLLFVFWESGGGKFRSAIIWGMLLFLLGNFTGYLMVAQSASVTGGTIADGTWLVTNWKPSAGDFRIAHFLGLHAVQVLPFCAWVLDKYKLSKSLIHLAGALYLAVIVFAMWYPMVGVD